MGKAGIAFYFSDLPGMPRPMCARRQYPVIAVPCTEERMRSHPASQTGTVQKLDRTLARGLEFAHAVQSTPPALRFQKFRSFALSRTIRHTGGDHGVDLC